MMGMSDKRKTLFTIKTLEAIECSLREFLSDSKNEPYPIDIDLFRNLVALLKDGGLEQPAASVMIRAEAFRDSFLNVIRMIGEDGSIDGVSMSECENEAKALIRHVKYLTNALSSDDKSEYAVSTSKIKSRAKAWLPLALNILKMHPGWSDCAIAEASGVNPSTLSRDVTYQRMKQLTVENARDNSTVKKGVRNKDGEIDAIDDRPPLSALSGLVSVKCSKCGAKIRVNRSESNEKSLCEDCQE